MHKNGLSHPRGPHTIAYNLLSCFAATNLVSSSEIAADRASIAAALEVACWLRRLALKMCSDVRIPGKPYVARYNLQTANLDTSASPFSTLRKYQNSSMNRLYCASLGNEA